MIETVSDYEDDEDVPSLTAGMQAHDGHEDDEGMRSLVAGTRRPKWVGQSALLRQELQAHWEADAWYARPWTQPLRGLPPLLIGVHTARTLDLVDIAAIDQCRRIGCSPRALAQDDALRRRVAESFYVDVSQSHKRRPWRKRAPTATTAMQLYSFSEDHVLLEEELFAAYGRHVEVDAMIAVGLGRADLRNLLGDCMAVQPVATILHCMVVSCAQGLPSMLEARGSA